MAGGQRRKCKCCRRLFRPDPRSRRHQRYCSEPPCRAASKAASQARWLAKPENQGYFRDPWHVIRVRAWRSRHPGYWRKPRRCATALQDVSRAQSIDSKAKTANFRAITVTRSHNGATRCSHWLNRPSRGHTATRGPRPHHRPFGTPRPRHSRHVAGPGRSARPDRAEARS